MGARAVKAFESCQMDIYNLFLTLDLLEHYLTGYDGPSFGSCQETMAETFLNLLEISLLVERIPVAVRFQYPAVPWSFLEKLVTTLSQDYLLAYPQVAWVVINRRVLSARPALAAIINGESDHIITAELQKLPLLKFKQG